MDRRTFLSSLAAATVCVACSSGDDDNAAGSDGSATQTTGSGRAVTAAQPAASVLPAAAFALGVASGDPTDSSVMLWTRLVAQPTEVGGAIAPTSVELAVDVAIDEDFNELVISEVVTAAPDRAHSVHVDATGLAADAWYFYRFRTADQTSAVGRTRTCPAPDADPAQFRFVFASCQDFQWGHYGAWRHAAAEADLDAIVFLGDYIYESNLGDLSPTKAGDRVWANAAALSLDDYRVRYAQTKADPLLQGAHQAAPWLITFDDHEVSNNYAGDVGQTDVDQPSSRDRRLAAYQAWYEHMPIRLLPEPTSFEDLTVHRSLTFGSLASLFAIETRQHADPPPCREPQPEGTPALAYSDDGPACEGFDDEGRTNLGSEQEAWLLGELGTSTSTWNVLANPLMLAGLNIGTAEQPEFTRDTWDGYPAVRNRVLGAILDAEVPNPVAVTGDWHASFVSDVIDGASGETVMTEFLASSISTVIFPTDYRAQNPHVKYFATEHGYGLATITADELVCEFKYVADVWDPETPISVVDRFRLESGNPVANPA